MMKMQLNYHLKNYQIKAFIKVRNRKNNLLKGTWKNGGRHGKGK